MKLKLQYPSPLMQRADTFQMILMLGKTEGKRRGGDKGWWVDSITDSMDLHLRKLQETVEDKEASVLQSMGLQSSGHHLATKPDGKESSCHAGDPGLIPGLGGWHGEGNSYLLQHSCLGNPMDRGAWRATVPGVTKESGTTEQQIHVGSK